MLDFGFYNMDCMEGMKQFPDKYFDLAIVDPPYGDGGGTWTNGTRFGERFNRYTNPSTSQCRSMGKWLMEEDGGGWSIKNGRNMGSEIRKKIVAWDVAPGKDYFDELFRISRNQIIWGGELL